MSSRMFCAGSTMVVCVIVLAVVATLAVGVASMASANLQIADNQSHMNAAFFNAESGLEVMRYWLDRAAVPSSTPTSEYLSTVIDAVQADMEDSGATALTLGDDGVIPSVDLADGTETFSGKWDTHASDPNILLVAAMGLSQRAGSAVQVQFSIEPYRFPIFNYGVATKGSIRFPQNPTLTGATSNWEADIYIDSPSDVLAIQVGGNANFDGNIDIGNPAATVDFQGDIQIAGDHGQVAIDEHVNIGADAVEFPVPELTSFYTYATGAVLDPNTDLSGSMTIVNATIPANTNPTFLGNVTIQGILLIEQPNVVTFSRNVELQGLIVADGDVTSPGANAINFEGNFSSDDYPSDPQFDAIRQEQGSSILAPGFGVNFTGNFASVNGVIAGSSLYFASNASAVVRGTMISYSPDATMVEGNISMEFDRADVVEIPAGFDLLRVLDYDPNSYCTVQ